MKLNNVYTLAEAADLWNMSTSNMRNALTKFDRFGQQIKDGTVKKSAGTWIVTREAMEQVFGPMPQYRNEDTGAIIDAQELHEMHLREWREMWSDKTALASEFKTEDEFIKYMQENEVDWAFHLIGGEGDERG